MNQASNSSSRGHRPQRAVGPRPRPRLPLAVSHRSRYCCGDRQCLGASPQPQQRVRELGRRGEIDVVAARDARAAPRARRNARAASSGCPSDSSRSPTAWPTQTSPTWMSRAAHSALRLRSVRPTASALPARESSRAVPPATSPARWPGRSRWRAGSPRCSSPPPAPTTLRSWLDRPRTWKSTAGSAPTPAAPRTSSTSARSRAPLVASRRYRGASSSHDSRRGSCISSGSVSSSGTAARMSSAPPRPASVRAMPVAMSPSACARGSVTAGCSAAEPVGQRRGRPRVAEVVRRVHRVGQRDRFVRPRIAARSAATSRKSSASRSEPVRAAIDARSSTSRRPTRRAVGVGRHRRASLVQQRERAVAACPPSMRCRRRAAAVAARSPHPESGAPTARTPPTRPSTPHARRHARRPRRADRRPPRPDARSPRRDATPAGPRPPAASRRRRRDAPRAGPAPMRPEYTAARSSGCRNSTRPPRTVTSPRSSASSEPARRRVRARRTRR